VEQLTELAQAQGHGARANTRPASRAPRRGRVDAAADDPDGEEAWDQAANEASQVETPSTLVEAVRGWGSRRLGSGLSAPVDPLESRGVLGAQW